MVCRQIKMDTSNKRTFPLYNHIPQMANVTKQNNHKKKEEKSRIQKERKTHFLYKEYPANACDRNISRHSRTHDPNPSFLYNSKALKGYVFKHATPFKVPI